MVEIELRAWREADVGRAQLITRGIEDTATIQALADLIGRTLGCPVQAVDQFQEEPVPDEAISRVAGWVAKLSPRGKVLEVKLVRSQGRTCGGVVESEP